MMNIESYLDDGANWQAQAVLAYMRDQKSHALDGTWNKESHRYEAELYVGRYENCREQGYIFSIRYKLEQRNYAVYEHRNSDNLCVVVFDGLSINTPTLDDVCQAMGDNKYNYTKGFSYGSITECGDYIVGDMNSFISTLKDALNEE